MAKIVRFDCYEVDLAAGQVHKRGAPLRLPDQQFRVLASLLERPGQVVTREDLRRRLWPDDVFVDFENNLNIAVARLRQVLGDSAERPRFVETLPKRGYRFVADVFDATPAPEIPGAAHDRVVVLPFANLTGDPGRDYLSDAMTEEVITELAALAPDLGVIARTTAMRYKGTRKDVTRIGRELNVQYVVEGGVCPDGDRIAITAQLIRVSDQTHVWARRYEGPSGDLFSLRTSVARAIAGTLGMESGERSVGRGGATGRTSPDPIACNEYIQGRYYLDRMDLRNYSDVRSHLEKSIARDPGFALAHEALAQMYWLLGYGGFMPPRDAFGAGVLHAVRAIEIDGARAETRALVAQYRKQLDYDWPEIERELSSALQMNPASSLVRLLYAVGWLMPQGRIQDAIAELGRALEWDPLSYHVHHWLTVMFVLAHDWDRTVDQARLLIELEPDVPLGPWLLAVGLRGKGLLDESVAAQRRAVDLSGGTPMMLGWLGLILGLSGRADEALAVLDHLEALARTTTYVPPSSFAWVYLGLRHVDRAFEWLDRAIDARDQFMAPIKTYAFLDPIRNDPRFAALLRKMKLA
ncbi:MAG: winged helix-turn-helix domain-containing protein [Bacteroidales bacterium]